MKRIFVLSNNCISASESNGRTHGSLFWYYEDKSLLHNFFISGCPDIAEVNYLQCSLKRNLLSKITLGLRKTKLSVFKNKKCGFSDNVKHNSLFSKSPFFHLVRNNLFYSSQILRELAKYISFNKIDLIQIWGSNIPSLYKYGYKLSKMTNVPLSILTGEDYPIKKYNFINKHSLFFPLFRRKLFGAAKKSYKISKYNFYNSEELRDAYQSYYGTKNGNLFVFPSFFKASNFVSKTESNILYAGNLYSGRCDSILDVADSITDLPVKIDVYGKITPDDLKKLVSRKNIIYHGCVPYSSLLDIICNSSVLLHVEGFSKEYINDCRYAFSSKISDCFCSGKKVFIYGPEDISGVKFVSKLEKRIVATSKDELIKLRDVINQNIILDSFLVEKTFGVKSVSSRIKSVIEGC